MAGTLTLGRSSALTTSRLLWGAASGVSVLLVLALLALLQWQRQADAQHALAQQALMARVLEEHAARTLDAVAAATAVLAENATQALTKPATPGAAPDLDAVEVTLRQSILHQTALRGVGLLAADGHVLAGAGTLDTGRRVDLQALGPLPSDGQSRLLAVRAGRSLPTPDQDSTPGIQVLPWVRAVQTGQGLVYAVALINPDLLASFQRQTLQDPALSAALVDFDGRLVAGTGVSGGLSPEQVRSLPPLARWLPDTEQASWQGAGLQPGERIASFRALRQYPLWVMVDRDRAPVLAQAPARLKGFVTAAVISILLVVGMAALLARALRASEGATRRLMDAQNDLARRNQEMDAVFTSVRELLFRTDGEGRLQLVNARWSSATGVVPQTCLGKHLTEWVAEESRPTVAHLLRPQADALPRHAEIFIDTPTGRCHYEMTVVALLDGEVLQGFAGSAVDITELVNMQLMLREQLAFNDALIENNPLPVVVRDLDNRYLRVNPAWESFTGRPRHEVVGTPASLQHAPEHASVHELKDRELLAQGQGEIQYEAQVRRADGLLREVLVSKALIRDGRGAVVAIVGSFTDISELREAERATRLAKEAAESASAAKTEFIANISHELRTPLQAILGFSELGQLRVAHEPKLRGMFGEIHHGGQRMLSLVNELLDLSKLDRSSLQLSRQPVNVRPLLETAVAELQPLAMAKQLQVTIHMAGADTVLQADGERIAQVLRNLLANAIRFSPAGSSIELMAHPHAADGGAAGLMLTVADRGPGVPPAELESIFEPFVQSTLTKDGSGGTGLGLAIARRIVSAHGGWIHARNRDGGGAEFQLWLPLPVNTPEPVPIEEAPSA